MSTTKNRLLVIGLDGATFDLMRPWAEAGELPNLQRLMSEGSWGPLRSVVHPFTAQAWTSMVTGTQQGKHRVFDFWERDFATYGFRLLNASHRALPALWNLLSAAGKDVIIVNLPQTYPPEPVQGVMVSGRDTPGLGAAYTYPASLKGELDEVSDTPYVIVPDDWLWMQRGRPDLARAELLREIDVRFDAARHLMETRPWDMTFFVVSATDGVAHFFWKYHDPTHPLYDPVEAERYGNTILEVYRRCDQRIGELLAWLEETGNCNVLVVSDHGQGQLGSQAIHLNLWLAGQGLLHFRSRADKRPLGERATTLASRAVQQGKRSLYGRIRFQTLTKLRRLWPDSLRTRLGAEAFFPDVEWSHTRAFSEELRGNIWINLRGRDPQGVVEPGAEYEALRDEIIAALPKLADPVTGDRPIRRVWRREELYRGPYLERLPDLIVEADYPDMFKPHGAYHGTAAVRNLSAQEMRQRAITGCHRMNGVLIAWGPDVEPGSSIDDAALIDVAPTVLHMLGQPVPREMDGRVLAETLRDDVLGAVRPTTLTELGFDGPGAEVGFSDDEAEYVRERLAGLGYLG
ncbi:MAG: alkaline phosphatase family protein [Anaerolineales bacterium]|nr:alkaline phosphatase family protein [Anaerolineae bacterium]MCB0230776.1 alkaline phosphatase family protein [Anaerolineae bacterium]MCB9130624.1 alkaline phosphatase family protein [Anaerolineales bacterium]MCB9142373.1 alkaline phosphatase family protein [Anaerolineales bacterium]HRX03747.1 alkaline phosphatase family protein [Anaerolineae bacterium]